MTVSLARAIAAAVALGAARAQDLVVEVLPFPGTHLGHRCHSIVESDDRQLWFGYPNELLVHDGERLQAVPLHDVHSGERAEVVRHVVALPDAVVLVCVNGLWSVAPDHSGLQRIRGSEHIDPLRVVAANGGTWVRCRHHLRHYDRDWSLVAECAADADDLPRGLVANDRCAWLWSERQLQQLAASKGRVEFAHELALPGVRCATAHDGALFVVAGECLHRVGADGSTSELLHDPRLSDADYIAVVGGDCWITVNGALWTTRQQTDRMQRVRLYGTDDAVTCLASDRQGLLWLGTASTIYRAQLSTGIDCFEVATTAGRTEITAITEWDGSMVLGTSRGAVLRDTPTGWTELATPWTGAAVADLATDDRGLVVALRRHGVWRFDGDWTKLADGWNAVRGAFCDRSGLWITADREIVRLSDDAPTAEPPFRQRLPAPANPATVRRLGNDALWLSAYLGGLWVRRGDATAFEQLPGDWSRDAIFDFAAADDDSLWVASVAGLWLVDRGSGERSLVVNNSRSSPFRLLARQPAGDLWLVRGTQLVHFDPRGNVLRPLPPGCGSHPTGFSLRSCYERADGELWLGATNGYTRVSPTAAAHLGSPGHIRRVECRVGGRLLDDPATSHLDGRIVAGRGPILVHPVLVDRSVDVVQPPTIALDGPAGERLLAVDGRFESLPVGVFKVSALMVDGIGATDAVPIGVLHSVPPPPQWPIWFAAALAGLLVVVTPFALLVKRRRTLRGVIYLGRAEVADAMPEISPQATDVMHLAVAAGEACAHRGLARHTSVWMRDPRQPKRLQLARFGADLRDSAERIRVCCEQGVPIDEHLLLHQRGRHRDLVICARGDSLEFEILAHGVDHVSKRTAEEFRQLASALFGALTSLRWMARLEAQLVERSTSIAADTHDLRSPLTVLRLSAYELLQIAAPTEPAVKRLTAAIVASVERVLAAVESMQRRTKPVTDLRLRPAQPFAFVARKVGQIRDIAAMKGVRVRLHNGPSDVSAMLDEEWFERVLENLLGNAIKYTATNSEVVVSCFVEAERAVVFFDDEGPGFTAAERRIAFLPGMIGRAKPTGNEPRSGMGLWIARQAMLAMGGDLWIGDRDGAGARLTLTVPIATTATATP